MEERGMFWPSEYKIAVSIILDPGRLVLRNSSRIEGQPDQTPNAAADAGGSEPSKLHERPSKTINPSKPAIPFGIQDEVDSLLKALRLPRIVETRVLSSPFESSSPSGYSVRQLALDIGDILVLNGSEIVRVRAGGIPLVSMRYKGKRTEMPPTAGGSTSPDGREAPN
jgi:hypothetical protein